MMHLPDASFCPETSGTRYPAAEILPLKWCIRNPNYVVLLGAFLVFLRANSVAETRRSITAAGVERDIKANGAPSVVKQLKSGKGEQWQTVVRNVETGSTPWLHVARQLLLATDVGNTESLYFAFSLALTRNPGPVLVMLGPELPAGKICTVPYIEPSPKIEREHRAKVRAALATVTQSDLAAQKETCLRELAVGEK